MLEIREIPGKGCGAVSNKHLESGEIVLNEFPILLYPQHSTSKKFCAYCLRSVDLPECSPTPCQTCSRAIFCSPACAAAAATEPSSHCNFVCRTLTTCNLSGLSDDASSSLEYLIRSTSLLIAGMQGHEGCRQRYEALTNLVGYPSTSTLPASANCVATKELHGRLAHALDAVGAGSAIMPLESVALLLDRDAVNSYAILEPNLSKGGQRVLRGTGLYQTASRLNNDCLPNLARFDNFDTPCAHPGGNTSLSFRALHALPAGEELTISYFPLTWNYEERKQRTEGHYGFQCQCNRCKLEHRWETEDNNGEDGVELGEEESEGGITAGYIHTFLLKYVCAKEDCQGTLCPISGNADVSECNVCGCRRTEAEFQAALEADFAGEDEEFSGDESMLR